MQDINKLRNDSGIPKGFYRKLVKIALPIAVQGIISSSLGLVDNIMVGSLGEEALAAVGIAMQIFLFNIFSYSDSSAAVEHSLRSFTVLATKKASTKHSDLQLQFRS